MESKCSRMILGTVNKPEMATCLLEVVMQYMIQDSHPIAYPALKPTKYNRMIFYSKWKIFFLNKYSKFVIGSNRDLSKWNTIKILTEFKNVRIFVLIY